MIIVTTILLIILLYEIYKFHIYKSCTFILYWFSINTFVLPIVWYSFLGETAYKKFSEDAYEIYIFVGIIYFLSIILITYFFKSKRMMVLKFKINYNKWGYRVFIFSIFFIVFWYMINYGMYIPWMKIFFGSYTGSELSNRSLYEIIPHYFTFQHIMMNILPMIFLYLMEKNKVGKFREFSYILLSILCLFMGGKHAMGVYYLIFIWIYKWKWKMNIELFLLLPTGFISYFVIKKMSFENIALIIGPIRRFSLTQAAMLINRISMIEEGEFHAECDIIFDVADSVYQYLYRDEFGSAPTFYLGDLIVLYGYWAGMIFSIMILFMILFLGRCLDTYYDFDVPLYKTWAYFSMIYYLGNAGITIAFIWRMIIILIALCFIEMDGRNYSGKKVAKALGEL